MRKDWRSRSSYSWLDHPVGANALPARTSLSGVVMLRRISRLRSKSRKNQRVSSSSPVYRACFEALEGRTLLSFGTLPAFTSDPSIHAIATADFNGDGRSDIIATDFVTA